MVIQVQAVRGALHVAAAPIGQVPLCRQTQVVDLQAFLGQGLQECRGSSIYVSGVPGTGLSPLVSNCQIDEPSKLTASCACHLSILGHRVSPHRMAEAIRNISLVIHANDHLSSLSAVFNNLPFCHCVIPDGNSDSISLSTLRDSCLVGPHGTMAEQFHRHAAIPRQHS